MPEKPLLVTRSSMPPMEEYIQEIQGIWDSAWLTNNGSLHRRFEKEAAHYLGVGNLSLFANGHLALCAAIDTLALTGEVITTPFTFVSTTHAITQHKLKAVFCDIDPGDYTMDVSRLESLITEKTSAIVPVHVYGTVCNLEAIQTIARKYNLKVIYDAAHAFGVQVNGSGIGSFGDVSMFSFHATKVFHTIEGGGLTYSDPGYKNRFDLIKNFGITSPERVEGFGTNAKMNEFQAAMGICNLRHIDEEIKKRQAAAQRYREHLADVPGIKLLQEQKGVQANYAYFPVVFDPSVFGRSRDQVLSSLAKHNIYGRKYFYPLTNNLECYRGVYSAEQTPVAKTVADQVMTLPLYAALELSDVDRICQYILA